MLQQMSRAGAAWRSRRPASAAVWMVRLSWRQFRTQALVAYAALAVIAVILAITGPHLVHLYDATVAPCKTYGDCGIATTQFLANDHLLQAGLNSALLVLPALVGIFWGAPLVARELEAGTFRLAWTQSVTRTRWLAVKLGVVGLSGMVVTGLFSLMVTWWSSPFDRVNVARLSPAMFGERGLAPVGYAAFAFALGVIAGVVIRRTLPAMAATLAAFLGARLVMTYWVRPNLLTPLHITSALQTATGNAPPSLAGTNPADWVLSSQTINAAGQVIGQNGGIGPNGDVGFNVASNGTLTFLGVGRCPNRVQTAQTGAGAGSRVRGQHAAQAATQECIEKLHIRDVLTYQPASRYWAFQWYETAIFLGLALLLAGLCFWWIRRRLT